MTSTPVFAADHSKFDSKKAQIRAFCNYRKCDKIERENPALDFQRTKEVGIAVLMMAATTTDWLHARSMSALKINPH